MSRFAVNLKWLIYLPPMMFPCETISLAMVQLAQPYLTNAAGVELSGVLIIGKLLILGTATAVKKARLPDPLFVYCTKMLFARECHRNHI
jgi:hypothetical protein